MLAPQLYVLCTFITRVLAAIDPTPEASNSDAAQPMPSQAGGVQWRGQVAREALLRYPMSGKRGPAKRRASMAPVAVDEVPAGDDWLHEIKYDGYRMHARLDGGKSSS